MIIRSEADVTAAVLMELGSAFDDRFRTIMAAAVRHLHDFVREAAVTEAELQLICRQIARLGQATTDSHNEVVLAAGSLGVSALVCLLNNAASEGARTTANLLGPFWRDDSPLMPNGSSLVRSESPGALVCVDIQVRDRGGAPVPNARVDVWHASAEGLYENQDPKQAEMNLRGSFRTDADGRVWFRSIKPTGYPIPVDGPVGDLLRMQGRHNMRPAHLHFLIHKEGFKTQHSQVYSSDDPNLLTDVQFGVTEALIGRYVRHEEDLTPADDSQEAWYSLSHEFVLDVGEAQLPRAPICGKAEDYRSPVVVRGRRSTA